RAGIGADVGPVAGPVRALPDRHVVAALVAGAAVAEVERGQGVAAEIERAVDRTPVLLVQHVDALVAEDPAVLRQVVGGGVGAAQRPVDRRAGAVHVPAGAGIAGGAGFQHVLGRTAAIALGGAHLEHEAQGLAGLPVGVQRDVLRGGGRAGARDHVVHAE